MDIPIIGHIWGFFKGLLSIITFISDFLSGILSLTTIEPWALSVLVTWPILLLMVLDFGVWVNRIVILFLVVAFSILSGTFAQGSAKIFDCTESQEKELKEKTKKSASVMWIPPTALLCAWIAKYVLDNFMPIPGVKTLISQVVVGNPLCLCAVMSLITAVIVGTFRSANC